MKNNMKNNWLVVTILYIVCCFATYGHAYGPMIVTAIFAICIVIRIIAAFWGCKRDPNEPIWMDTIG